MDLNRDGQSQDYIMELFKNSKTVHPKYTGMAFNQKTNLVEGLGFIFTESDGTELKFSIHRNEWEDFVKRVKENIMMMEAPNGLAN